MSESHARIDAAHQPGPATSSLEPPPGVLTSIGFWICLLLAAAGYAAATLSGSYVENQQLAARHAVGAARLSAMAEQVDRYEIYVRRLASTPAARVSEPAMSSSIPLAENLQFHLDGPVNVTPDVPERKLPAWIALLSRSATARVLVLSASAGLLLVAFTLCVASPSAEASRPPTNSGLRRSVVRGINQAATRYRVGPTNRPYSSSRASSAGGSLSSPR